MNGLANTDRSEEHVEPPVTPQMKHRTHKSVSKKSKKSGSAIGYVSLKDRHALPLCERIKIARKEIHV